MRIIRAALAIASLTVTAVGAQTRVARGVVARGDSHDPLPFSVISVVGTSIERFADDSGRFTIEGLPAGSVTLLVRHIGFSPREVALSSDAPVRVELDHVAVALAGVHVEADRECTNPGPPREAPSTRAESLLGIAVQQLIQNGEQYRLVTRSYPFLMTIRQRYYFDTPSGRIEQSDGRQRISSDVHWDYQPGHVVEETRMGRGVNVPTIAVFAEESFLKSHCFYLQGVTSDSAPLLAIDFRAASRIKDPDIDGTIYLDPATYMIRRSLIRVSKMSRQIEEFAEISIDTRFEEVYPGVPIVTAIDGDDRYVEPQGVRGGPDRLALRERQRVLSLGFTKGQPGDSVRRASSAPIVRWLDRIIGVYDDSTGQPIAGATLRDTLSKQSIKTLETGTSRLAFVLDDHAVIEVSAPGYETTTLPVTLSLRALTPITMTLHRKPEPSRSP